MPNAKNEKELTAYLSEYKVPFIINKKDVHDWLEECEYTEKILE